MGMNMTNVHNKCSIRTLDCSMFIGCLIKLGLALWIGREGIEHWAGAHLLLRTGMKFCNITESAP